LRNVLDHADARNVTIALAAYARGWDLSVVDDGRGIESEVVDSLQAAAEPSPDGQHLGLRLLAELAADVDGTLSVTRDSGGGTRVCLRIPAV
jgi:nitrate/nitrite-specific signal transduction histidine kinase